MDMNKEILFGQIRTLLAAIGGFVVHRGYISDTMVTIAVGVIMAVLPLAWSAWAKFQSEKKTQAREVVAVNVGIAVADKTLGPTPAVSSANAPAVIEKFAPKL